MTGDEADDAELFLKDREVVQWMSPRGNKDGGYDKVPRKIVTQGKKSECKCNETMIS